MLEDRRVERHDVVALGEHRAPPLVLDVGLQQDAVVAVVVRRPQATVDLRRGEHEAASLAERHDLVHRHAGRAGLVSHLRRGYRRAVTGVSSSYEFASASVTLIVNGSSSPGSTDSFTLTAPFATLVRTVVRSFPVARIRFYETEIADFGSLTPSPLTTTLPSLRKLTPGGALTATSSRPADPSVTFAISLGSSPVAPLSLTVPVGSTTGGAQPSTVAWTSSVRTTSP